MQNFKWRKYEDILYLQSIILTCVITLVPSIHCVRDVLSFSVTNNKCTCSGIMTLIVLYLCYSFINSSVYDIGKLKYFEKCCLEIILAIAEENLMKVFNIFDSSEGAFSNVGKIQIFLKQLLFI